MICPFTTNCIKEFDVFIIVFERMHVKYHYNTVQKWYSSPYALSDEYYSYAIVFVFFEQHLCESISYMRLQILRYGFWPYPPFPYSILQPTRFSVFLNFFLQKDVSFSSTGFCRRIFSKLVKFPLYVHYKNNNAKQCIFTEKCE